MMHCRSLAIAAVLRWRRNCCDALGLLCHENLGIDTDCSNNTWKIFEEQQLRAAVDRTSRFVSAGLFIVVFVLVAGLLARSEVVLRGLNVFVLAILQAFTWLVQKHLRGAVAKQVDLENHWCVLHQCVLACACYAFALTSLTGGSVLIAHRGFCIKYIITHFMMSFVFYLPIRIHLIFVTCQGIFVWILFHWAMDFLWSVPVFCAVGLPMLELLSFHYARNHNWYYFCVAEKEKRARTLSDALQETLRGVLEATFDASCDCDDAGCIVFSSSHLQELLGRCDLVGLDFAQLAASSVEAQRIRNFVSQILAQKQQGAHPLVQLETVLRCKWPCDHLEDTELTVKMCCMSFPSDNDSRQFFVGLRKVQPPDYSNNQSEGQVSPRCYVADEAVAEPCPWNLTTSSSAAAAFGKRDNVDWVPRAVLCSESASLASFSFTVSATTGRCPLPFVHAGTQTGTPSKEDVSIQTDNKPPRPCLEPRLARPSRRGHQRLMRSDPLFGKRFLRKFQATGVPTVELLVQELAVTVNPRVANMNCCFYHVSLNFLQHVILQMLLRTCNATWFPNIDWQCQYCGILQSDEPASDEEHNMVFECEFCSAKRQFHELSYCGESSGVPLDSNGLLLADASASWTSGSALDSH